MAFNIDAKKNYKISGYYLSELIMARDMAYEGNVAGMAAMLGSVLEGILTNELEEV